VGCDAARSWYRKRDSARDVTPASLVAGAGGAALAYSEHSAREQAEGPRLLSS